MELIAIKKNDKYYIRHKTDKYFTFKDYVFDTILLPSFSDVWVILKDVPTQIQKKSLPFYKIIGYKLKPGYPISDLTPEKMPSDAFEYLGDDEYRNSHIRGLYEEEYETIPERLENIDFTIDLIDTDCEPLINTKYPFITDFPYFIENHEVVRHKYPCHLDAEQLFKIIVKYCKENLPQHCRINSHYSFHFSVEMILPVLHEETFQKDVAGMRARKPKYQTVPLRSIAFTVIDVGIGEYGKEKIESITAKNYYELESKIDNILEEYKERMQHRLAVCPHCKGYGFQIS